ncbi:hypothetical protein MLD52_19625 [Puniceicoccaceae bacterium K14]|nr:hypothetical protein [Puniceicoccaceae bacterium K14]
MYKPNYSKIVEVLESRSLGSGCDNLNRFVSEKDFDRSIWECSRSLLMDNEDLLRVYGERWAWEQFESGVLKIGKFHSSLNCIDWVFTELSLLRSAIVPGFDELNAMVLSCGPNNLSIRVICHKRGAPFLEGVAKGIARAYQENVETRMRILNPSCSDLQLRRLAR